MSKEAMKLALEALETELAVDMTNGAEVGEAAELMCEAIKALEEALAKQEQGELVAYLCENAVGHKYFRWKKPSSTYKPIALYTTPQQRTWVGLTDEAIATVYWGATGQSLRPQDNVLAHKFARAIEAAHGITKEKNT